MRTGAWKAIFAAAALLFLGTIAGARAADMPRNNYYMYDDWLCHPGREGPCADPLSTMVVRPKGNQTVERLASDPDAPIDCFYVYPTVSPQKGPLSDMAPGPEEIAITRMQAAAFGAKCRLFVPLYRQVTVPTLVAEAKGKVPVFDAETPARDVIAAWKAYLAHDNAYRGFVLIGHSQGATILRNLIAALIDGTPIAHQLVSVIIPGTDLDVPPGQDVGGSFAGIPLCRAAQQTGCVIAYSSFLANEPPGARANFSASPRPGMRDACVSPPALVTGGAALDALLPTQYGEARTRYRTAFFSVPGLLSASCVNAGLRTYLSVSVGQDRRTAAVLRFLKASGADPVWGLHAMDINLALGNLVAIVGAQSQAWLAHRDNAVARRDGTMTP